MAFRKIFLERGNVYPFEECTTVASTCMKVFRKNFLCKNEIGIVPVRGYRNVDKQSSKAIQWLTWMECELGQIILHAGRGRKYQIEGTRVDGYYETKVNNETCRHVLEFHGSFWHGCPACFKVNRDRALSSENRRETIDARYERTLARTRHLQNRGYRVTVMWECAFDRETRENRVLRNFLENHPMVKLTSSRRVLRRSYR